MRFSTGMTVGELQDRIHRIRHQLVDLQDNFRSRTTDKFIGSKKYLELCDYVENQLNNIIESFDK